MAVQFTPRELQEKYQRIAPCYDLAEGLPEILGIRRLRHQVLRSVSGQVLEVAAGTGKNFPHYPPDCRITAVDLTPAMLDVARNRAEKLVRPIAFAVMNGEALAFPDNRFDHVVSSLTLCTFPDPVAALLEMGRVCRREGRILLLEHGRSDREWLGRWQDRRADGHARKAGCHWNREPQELLRQAGFRLLNARRFFFGVFHLLEAAPPPSRKDPPGRLP